MKKRSNNPPLKAFGQRLRELRGKATREQISIKLDALGVPLGGSTLSQYERGFVWAPDATVLWGLATIYGVRHDELVVLLRENRRLPETAAENWSDLLRQFQDQLSEPTGGSDGPASAATARVQQRYDDLLKASNDVASVLFHAIHKLQAQGIVLPEDDARARTGKPVTHRAPRKAG